METENSSLQEYSIKHLGEDHSSSFLTYCHREIMQGKK